MSIFPVEFKLLSAEQVLDLTWSDGHTFRYSLRYLRGWCPCAACQGHFTGYKTFIASASAVLENVEPVGSYAIRPVWGDGHQSGIFSYAYLLELEAGPPDVGPTNEDCLRGDILHSPSRH